MKHFILLTLLVLFPYDAFSNDGDMFSAKTIEGVNMSFKVISETNKTCQVGSGQAYESAISTKYSGAITIPTEVNGYSVIGIGSYSLCYSGNKLTSVNIPNTINFIGDNAFENCTGLTTISIPNSVTSIGDYVFYNCSNINSFLLSENLTSIGKWAFKGCNGLKTLTLPKIESIGENAFNECKNLSTVTLSNSLTLINSGTFQNCCSLTTITIPESCNSIGSSAFAGCSSLQSITIPNSVISLGAYSTFSGCTSLTSVIISDNLTSISESTFINCTSLSSVVIPNSITQLGDRSFAFCSKLSSVSMSESLTSIGEKAFQECSSLHSITIPATVNTIKNYAFGWCTNLQSVSTKIQDPTKCTMGSYVFQSIPVNSVLYVPKGKVDAYQSHNEWNYYFGSRIIEEITQYSMIISASGNGSVTYGNTSIRNQSTSFTLNEGTKATISFTPDNGYRVKSLLVNSVDKKSDISNNQYTINSISANTTVNVEFEAIPPTTYTLSIKASGNGKASYGSTEVRNNTSTFTVNKGTSATITFTPDEGYRIKSVKVGDTDVTSSISNNSYTISSISGDTTVEVEFEAIPVTTYTLSIKATGNGKTTYGSTDVRNNTSTFTVNKGTSATITFTPDDGYRIKSVKIGNTDVTSNVSNNSYTISSINSDTTVEVEFEVIPPTTYTLSIKVTGNGKATYESTDVRSTTTAFIVNEGTSVTISFTPDEGYRIKSVKVGDTDVTSSISNNPYTISSINSDTTVGVEFEAIPPTTYTLSIKATGNGKATYGETDVRDNTSTFTVNEGTTVTITFTPDDGYRIKSVKVGNTDVTFSVSNNSYTISSINSDTTVEVEFEVIPPTTYTLSIKATGNGKATYGSTDVRNNTSTFTVNKGTSATITFTPDDGYRIKSVKVGSTDVTSSISNNSYIISSISGNTTVEVEFEVIPPTTYTLSIKATGNGKVTYGSTDVRNNTSTFTVNNGTSATITFTPDNGYRIKSVKVGSTDVTSSISNNSYIISSISGNTTVEVEFEVIPPTTYTLSIKATGNGKVTYGSTDVRNNTSTFTVNKGTSATITFTPDNGYRIKSVKNGNTDVTSSVSGNQYTISSINSDTTIEVEFVEDIKTVSNNGVNYNVVSQDERTVNVASGDYGLVLDVPATFTANNKEWKVVGIEKDALKDNSELAAIIWNPEVKFTENVNNPNLLLYVKSTEYAPSNVKNIIANSKAKSITLTDASNGNNFYCPQEFTAEQISYEHNYSMKTGYKTCQGWESIVLPFNVAVITNNVGTELVPYSLWSRGDSKRPFWLYSMIENGWKSESAIKANTPYIISMPNNENYDATYNISGNIVFSASNVKVESSENLTSSKSNHKNLVPNYQNQESSNNIYALNVNNLWDKNTESDMAEGSVFIRGLRQVRPFEAYMTIDSGGSATRSISIFGDGSTTGIMDIPTFENDGEVKVYSLSGALLKQGKHNEVIKSLAKGIYIINNKKVVIK